ncbi:10300_t:CDS:2, partial [Acaulospora morrowiae]
HDRSKKFSPEKHLLTSIFHPHKDSKRQSFIDDELEIKEIIVIEIEEHRSLHLLDQEDKEIYERIKYWMKENPEASLLDTVNQFSSEPNGDAIAKILHNFQFPDYILKFTREEHEKRSVEKQTKRRNFERLLLRAGLVIEVENDAVNKEDFFVKIYAPFQKLCEQAQQIKLKMRLNIRDSVDLDINMKKEPSFYSSISKHFTYKINLDKQAAFFRVSKLRQFEGAEPEKSMGEIMLNFFSMSRRNLM